MRVTLRVTFPGFAHGEAGPGHSRPGPQTTTMRSPHKVRASERPFGRLSARRQAAHMPAAHVPAAHLNSESNSATATTRSATLCRCTPRLRGCECALLRSARACAPLHAPFLALCSAAGTALPLYLESSSSTAPCSFCRGAARLSSQRPAVHSLELVHGHVGLSSTAGNSETAINVPKHFPLDRGLVE